MNYIIFGFVYQYVFHKKHAFVHEKTKKRRDKKPFVLALFLRRCERCFVMLFYDKKSLEMSSSSRSGSRVAP